MAFITPRKPPPTVDELTHQVYARMEETTYPGAVEECHASDSPVPNDVQIYADAQATKPLERLPFFGKNPTKRAKSIRRHGFRYKLTWLPDLPPVDITKGTP